MIPLRCVPSIPLFLAFVSSLVSGVPQSLQTNSSDLEPPPLLQGGLEYPSNTSNTSATPSSVTKSSKDVTINHLKVRCDGNSFGGGLKFDSCMDAIGRMAISTTQRSFGQRGTGDFDVNLPFRMQSGDGTCVVDVVKATTVTSARASTHDIRVAATKAIFQCVEEGGNIGGSALGVGIDSQIGIVVKAYQPKAECLGQEPEGGDKFACYKYLQTMNASMALTKFGPKGVVGIDTPVPLLNRVGDPSRGCQVILNVNFEEVLESASWYDIWQAAESIQSMCGRFGKSGLVRNLGVHGRLHLALSRRSDSPP